MRGILLLGLLTFSGCALSTTQTASIRQEMVDKGVADLQAAYNEVIAAAQLSLKQEAAITFAALDAEHKAGLEKVHKAGKLTPESAVILNYSYMTQRTRLEKELLIHANNYASIATKVRNGQLTLDAIGKMEADRELSERDLLHNIQNDALPAILAGVGKWAESRNVTTEVAQ